MELALYSGNAVEEGVVPSALLSRWTGFTAGFSRITHLLPVFDRATDRDIATTL